MYEFRSVADGIADNGDRHVARALQHLADGKADYAAGSLAKALRNYVRAVQAGALFADRAVVEGLAAWRLKAEVKRQKALAQDCVMRLPVAASLWRPMLPDEPWRS